MDLTEAEKAALLDEAIKDRGLYKQILRASAKAHPEAYVPEVEIEDSIAQAKAEAAKEIQALKEQVESERAERIAAEELASAKRDLNLDEDGLKKLSGFMSEHGVTNMKDGLTFMRLSEANKEEAPEDRMSMRLPAGMAEALRNRRGARRKNIYSALADLRNSERRDALLSTR